MPDATRIETDSMGAVEVPIEALWGAQTQRSLQNFAIASDRMPAELIHALARIKQAATVTNARLGVLDQERCEQIVAAAQLWPKDSTTTSSPCGSGKPAAAPRPT